MGGKENPGAIAFLADDQVAHSIGLYLVGVGANQFFNNTANAALVSGGAVGFVQQSDQFK